MSGPTKAQQEMKQVRVITGPAKFSGRLGYLNEASGHVFFFPNEEPVTWTTSFRDAYPMHMLTYRAATQKEKAKEDGLNQGQSNSAPDAFR